MQLLLRWPLLTFVFVGTAIVASGARRAKKATPQEKPSTAFRDATQAAIASLAYDAPRVTTSAPAQMVLAAELELKKKDIALNQTLAELNRTEAEGGALVQSVATLQQAERNKHKEEVSLEDDKKALLKTVQDVMRTNQTRVEEEQVRDLSRLESSVQERCIREQEDLEARLQRAEARVKDAEAARDDAKEVAQALQAQHEELVKTDASLRAEIVELRKKTKGIEEEKSVALDSLRGLLKKNAQYKEKAAGPSSTTRFEHASDPVPDVNLRTMGETTAMDVYMSKVRGSSPVAHVSALPSADNGIARFRHAVRAAKARKSKKTGLLRWLDGDAQVVPVKAEAPIPAVSSPLDADRGLLDDAAETSSAEALLRRAEDALSL